MSSRSHSFLAAAEVVLRNSRRPLSSQEIVADARALGLIATSGTTPHKTMNARISEDIVRNASSSIFMRTYHGQFALREWEDRISEFSTKRRHILPMDEDILVIPKQKFDKLIKPSKSYFSNIDPLRLLGAATSLKRQDIEEDNNYVQIISLFHVKFCDLFLTYNRTRRLPEKRLHHTRSVNFGGHLQDSDRGTLFERDPEKVHLVFMRELHEELAFEQVFDEIKYIGSIYSNIDDFSSRHVGVCFRIVPSSTNFKSNEPGFLNDIRFVHEKEILNCKHEYDEWTQLVLKRTRRLK